MAARIAGNKPLTYLLGICMPSSKPNAAKIRVRKLAFNQYLHMYYNTYDFVYAHDPQNLCKSGDTVLIQNLPNKITRLLTHKVIEIVYPLGDITDPITGKKVISDRYREDIKEENKLYGECKSSFDYDKAPPRGVMKDKRDFTYQETYYKYYDDPDEPQPYGVKA